LDTGYPFDSPLLRGSHPSKGSFTTLTSDVSPPSCPLPPPLPRFQRFCLPLFKRPALPCPHLHPPQHSLDKYRLRASTYDSSARRSPSPPLWPCVVDSSASAADSSAGTAHMDWKVPCSTWRHTRACSRLACSRACSPPTAAVRHSVPPSYGCQRHHQRRLDSQAMLTAHLILFSDSRPNNDKPQYIVAGETGQ
jgi:hypothetical protein